MVFGGRVNNTLPPPESSDPPRPAAVVHVTFGLDIGGLEKLLVQYAAGTSPGYDVSVVCLGDDGPIGRQLRSMGLDVVTLGRPKGLRPTLWWQLWQHFRRVRPAVVHTHDIRPMIYAAPAAAAAGVPVRVHTQHGRSIGGGSRQLRLVRLASRSVTDMVGVSADVVEMTRAAMWQPRRFHTIRNGIDPSPYGRTSTKQISTGQTSTGQLSHHRRIVCVARLSPEKGVDVLIDAMGRLVRDHDHVHCRIAGDGVCRSDLEDQIRRLHLSDQVTLLGAIDDVAAELSGADVYVLPSRSEGVSLTLLEAMFSRVPIVATAVGGTPEVIHDGSTGRLVPPDDPDALATAIAETLAADPYTLRQQTDHAADQAHHRFSAKSMMRRYEQIYDPNSDQTVRQDADQNYGQTAGGTSP